MSSGQKFWKLEAKLHVLRKKRKEKKKKEKKRKDLKYQFGTKKVEDINGIFESRGY